MRIFKVSRPEDDSIDYDEYDSFVCVALDATAACRIHPRGNRAWVDNPGSPPAVDNEGFVGRWHWRGVKPGEIESESDIYHGWTCDIERLDVELIGDQFCEPEDGQQGVILASFNAG
jgi:hypothetical protein